MQEKYVMDTMIRSFKKNMKSIVQNKTKHFNFAICVINEQISNQAAIGNTTLALSKNDLAKAINGHNKDYDTELMEKGMYGGAAGISRYKMYILSLMYAIKYYYEKQGFNAMIFNNQLLISWSNKLDDITADTLHDYLNLDSLNEPLSKFPNQPIVFEPDEDDDSNFKSLEQTAPNAIDEPEYGDKAATQIRDRTKNSDIKLADDVKNLCMQDDSSCEDELHDHTLTDIQDLSGHALDDAQDLPDFNDTDNDEDLPDLDAQDMPALDAQDNAIDSNQLKKSSDNPNKMSDAVNDENNPFMSDEVPDKGPDALNNEPDPFMDDENSDNSKATKK